MKKRRAILVASILFILSSVGFLRLGVVSGADVQTNDTVVVSEPTDGVLAVSGESIIIEGDVNGPLFAAGQNIVVEGDVNGPIFAAGNTITIEGNVFGEVFLAGNTIRTVEGSEIRRDAFIAGNQVLLGASIGRDVFIGSNSTHIQNRIGRNANIGTNSLTFNDSGRIIGDLNYQSEQEAANVNEFVQGEINYQRPPRQQREQMMYRRSLFSKILSVIGAIVSAMLIWLFLRGITRGYWMTVSAPILRRPIILILIGFGLTLLTPIIIILALLSNVFSNIGFLILLLLMLLFFFGKIVVASVIGEYLLKNRIAVKKHHSLINFTVAYILLLLASYIPFIGWIISIGCIFYTIGLAFRETLIRFQQLEV